jgi:hypothetical protein
MTSWDELERDAMSEGMSKTDVLRFQIEQATRELMALERVPNPADQVDGTVIRWSQTFARSVRMDGTDRQSYTYVALKAGGRWYVTGTRHNRVWSSDKLHQHLAQAETSGVDIVSEWTALGTPAAGQPVRNAQTPE